MKNINFFFTTALFFILIIITFSCKKSSSDQNSQFYVPTSSDVTANATLAELQQGRALYLANCNKCHDLYNPDSYSPTYWKNILTIMGPNTSMTSSEITLVSKYLCRGK